MDTLNKTPLHALHLELGGRMVPFAGYDMPVQYPQGIKHEHRHTREHAGLFDISHMGQIKIHGEYAPRAMEALVPGAIEALQPGHQRYTLLTNPDGGIIDDIMVTRADEHLLLVVNAACKEKDTAYLKAALEPGCRVEPLAGHALLALQGPKAAQVLRDYISDIDQLCFMQAGDFVIDGIPCSINRCGYTGEDGFEISITAEDAQALAKMLLAHGPGPVEMIGLGARDTLRLEAGLCLYGHDIDERTTPVEAGLEWVIARKYRGEDSVAARFPGAEKILAQLTQGSETVRVGIRPLGKAPVREGTMIIDDKGEQVGRITSGGYAETVGGPIAMGYVKREHAVVGGELAVVIRERPHTIRVTTLPFIEHRYYNKRPA